jgi:hypothetical protein
VFIADSTRIQTILQNAPPNDVGRTGATAVVTVLVACILVLRPSMNLFVPFLLCTPTATETSVQQIASLNNLLLATITQANPTACISMVSGVWVLVFGYDFQSKESLAYEALFLLFPHSAIEPHRYAAVDLSEGTGMPNAQTSGFSAVKFEFT